VGIARGSSDRAFIRYSDGTTKIWLPPGAGSSWFYRRNASGVTVGGYRVSNTGHAIVYYGGNSYTEIRYPGASETAVYGINAFGSLVGIYIDSSTTAVHGFRTKSNKFIPFDYPGAIDTYAQAISDTGVIVGYFFMDRTTAARAFIYKNGIFTAYDYPATGAATTFNDINANGEIAGRNLTSGESGFIFKDGVFRTVVAPSGPNLRAVGINDYGVITGELFNSARYGQGYTATCK
jgi:hypothetical protein